MGGSKGTEAATQRSIQVTATNGMTAIHTLPPPAPSVPVYQGTSWGIGALLQQQAGGVAP